MCFLTLVTHTGEGYCRTAFVEKIWAVCSLNLDQFCDTELLCCLTQDYCFTVPCIHAPLFIIHLSQAMPKILQDHSALKVGNWWYRVGQLPALLFRVPAWYLTQNSIWGLSVLQACRWSFLSYLDRTVCLQSTYAQASSQTWLFRFVHSFCVCPYTCMDK